MPDPVWIPKRVVLALHESELARHGGPSGLRDEGYAGQRLGSSREPARLWPAGPLSDLAAAYAFGLAKNHAFVDGNKRASLTTCVLLLRANGLDLRVPMVDCVATWQALAAGTLGEADLAGWLRARVVALA